MASVNHLQCHLTGLLLSLAVFAPSCVQAPEPVWAEPSCLGSPHLWSGLYWTLRPLAPLLTKLTVVTTPAKDNYLAAESIVMVADSFQTGHVQIACWDFISSKCFVQTELQNLRFGFSEGQCSDFDIKIKSFLSFVSQSHCVTASSPFACTSLYNPPGGLLWQQVASSDEVPLHLCARASGDELRVRIEKHKRAAEGEVCPAQPAKRQISWEACFCQEARSSALREDASVRSCCCLCHWTD